MKRTCRLCAAEKPLQGFQGTRLVCRVCRNGQRNAEKRRAYNQQYYSANHTAILAQAKEYHLRTKQLKPRVLLSKEEKLSRQRARALARYWKNPEHRRQLAKNSAQRNKERISAYNKQYRQNNKEALDLYQQRYHQEHPEVGKRKRQLYKQRHPEKIKEKTARHRARKASAPINDLTHAQWLIIQESQRHRCYYCGKRCKGHLTQDHILALVNGGSHGDLRETQGFNLGRDRRLLPTRSNSLLGRAQFPMQHRCTCILA
jgi:hypothetical protein